MYYLTLHLYCLSIGLGFGDDMQSTEPTEEEQQKEQHIN